MGLGSVDGFELQATAVDGFEGGKERVLVVRLKRGDQVLRNSSLNHSGTLSELFVGHTEPRPVQDFPHEDTEAPDICSLIEEAVARKDLRCSPRGGS